MHEFSVMTEIVSAINAEIKKHQFKSIEKVYLEVGELMFLGEDQLRFGYGILTQDNETLKNSELIIETKKPKIECSSCGYTGKLPYESIGDKNDPTYHFSFPKFSCPECNGPIKILEGRACIIRNITGTVEDE